MDGFWGSEIAKESVGVKEESKMKGKQLQKMIDGLIYGNKMEITSKPKILNDVPDDCPTNFFSIIDFLILSSSKIVMKSGFFIFFSHAVHPDRLFHHNEVSKSMNQQNKIC